MQRTDAQRKALGAVAVEGYRSGNLTRYEASRLLGLARFEFDEIVRERDEDGDG